MSADWLVIEVGGVGLRVEVPARRYSAVVPGDEQMLHTSLVVREDALTLFGFDSTQELEMFAVLIGVSGVGPRSALGILSHMTPAEIARAVAQEDDKPFRKVSGIGPKTSKLIAVQLAGKIDQSQFADTGGPAVEHAQSSHESRAQSSVQQGLIGLGWQESVAHQAVEDAVAAGAGDDESRLLRAALALLQGSGGRGGVR